MLAKRCPPALVDASHYLHTLRICCQMLHSFTPHAALSVLLILTTALSRLSALACLPCSSVPLSYPHLLHRNPPHIYRWGLNDPSSVALLNAKLL